MTLRTGKVSERGFTLVELCLVGMILSLFFALSWPVMNRMARGAELETACREIGYTLRFARDYALNENNYYCVRFDVLRREYGIGTENENGSGDAFIPLAGSLYKTRHWPAGIDLAAISGPQVVFYPDGTSQDFEVVFRNVRGGECALKLQGATGKAVITRNN